MSIARNLAELCAELPAGVTLVAVGKTHPVGAIVEAYAAGQRDFGENRPQEMTAKHAFLSGVLSGAAPSLGAFPDIRWHQIGHLQTNKVRLIAPFVEMIHSADSARLLREISLRAQQSGRVIDVLLEIRIASEQSKEGWEWFELLAWLETGEHRELGGVRFRGVMGVATNTPDMEQVRAEFRLLASCHAELREKFFSGGFENEGGFDVISAGMSGDYRIAIECGATMVRIGSTVFGARDYSPTR